MKNSGKCPKCQKTLPFIQFEEILIRNGEELFDTGVSLFCPYCQTILSTSLYTDRTADDILFNVKKIVEEVSDVLSEVQSVRDDVESLRSVLSVAASEKHLIPAHK